MVEEVVQASVSPEAPRAVINYIHRGFVDDRYNSKRQRRRLLYATSVRERVNSFQLNFSKGSVSPINDIVTFLPVGANWVLQPHKDALVLTLGVGGFDVRRILVDSGSSTDLLQMPVFKQMGYSPSALKNLGCFLSGFNGVTTSPSDVLSIQAGPVTLNVQFSVVDDLSPYNAIMGHAWLHKTKVILSTYH